MTKSRGNVTLPKKRVEVTPDDFSYDKREFTDLAWEAIVSSKVVAKESKHGFVETEHLLKSLLEQRNSLACKIFSKAGVNNAKLLDATKSFIDSQPKVQNEAAGSVFGRHLEALIQRAREYKKEYWETYVSVDHLVLGFAKDKKFGRELFKDFQITITTLKYAMISIRWHQANPGCKYEALEKYGKDLTAMAHKGKLDPVIGRDDEIRRCIKILSKRKKNNALLIGEPGVGKTAIAEGLAQWIVEENVPQVLVKCRLISLDMGALTAGAERRGTFEDRIKSVIREVTESDEQVILFIDEIHTVVGSGRKNGAMDAGNLLKPMLGQGLRCLGATTLVEYNKYIESDPALVRHFMKVNVTEPTVEVTISILRGLRKRYELDHGVCISDSALVEAAVMSDRYISDRFLPDKAIDIVDEAAASLQLEITSKSTCLHEIDRSGKCMPKKEVTAYDIADVVMEWTGIPVSKPSQSEREKVLHFQEELQKRVIGQDPAVKAVADSIRRSRAGLSNPKRPIASFMFMGPTGVGKTELAKALASTMFNNGEALVRIDMSEYMERYSISKLIGASPGYVGYKEGGQLSEAVRGRPYTVVLFDEIEKAHSDVLNIFLQILDDGMVTDSKGRKVSFRNTIVIMTSNVGSKEILNMDKGIDGGSSDYETIKTRVMDAAENVFRPEFINRIDEFIVFRPLDQDEINKIVTLQLGRVQHRLADHKIRIEASNSAIDFLGKLSYDPKYGARPVNRVLQQYVENELANRIHREDFKHEDKILIDTEVTVPANGLLPEQKLVFRNI
ncbi:hypothetical protein LUZ63_005986 [Rhynchospora breviuscula]|uniref:Clp R domain-containing protein n=1 Tax=Rhynchospora breviuscula TaxID=2022672 RepID=A0A9Q0CQ27_9POAL|nr:hypothetical protein LUZ63_005986 [Rhynchospora breviuscula]